MRMGENHTTSNDVEELNEESLPSGIPASHESVMDDEEIAALIAKAEHKSHLAAEAVRKAERLSELAEVAVEKLRLAQEIYEQYVKKEGKIKGTVVLMTKKVLDFDNVKLNTDLLKFLGGAVSLQLIMITAQNADPGKWLGELGVAASLEDFVTTLPTLLEDQSAFTVQFDYSNDFGVPRAFVIRNNLSTEFYLVSLTLDDIPNHGSVHFVCNSWIHPANRYRNDLIFFAKA